MLPRTVTAYQTRSTCGSSIIHAPRRRSSTAVPWGPVAWWMWSAGVSMPPHRGHLVVALGREPGRRGGTTARPPRRSPVWWARAPRCRRHTPGRRPSNGPERLTLRSDRVRGLPSPAMEEDPVHAPPKRLNREIERRTDVALVCPTTTPVARTTCLGTPPVVRSTCPGLLLRSPPMTTGDRCGGACPAPRMTG